MKKEFYVGQPLIIKDTGEKVNFAYEDNGNYPCNIFGKEKGDVAVNYYKYEEVEPSTEFKLSELMAGMEQGYFEEGTTFTGLDDERQTLEVKHGSNGLYLDWWGSFIPLSSSHFSSTWQIDGH